LIVVCVAVLLGFIILLNPKPKIDQVNEALRKTNPFTEQAHGNIPQEVCRFTDAKDYNNSKLTDVLEEVGAGDFEAHLSPKNDKYLLNTLNKQEGVRSDNDGKDKYLQTEHGDVNSNDSREAYAIDYDLMDLMMFVLYAISVLLLTLYACIKDCIQED
jgi:hypothetical protein